MGNCKNCVHWTAGICESVPWRDSRDCLSDNQFAIYAEADDDQGLQAGLKTGPMFGCVRFLSKVKTNDD